MKNNQGKIGVFDSGLGGLTILKEVAALMPNREYIYLGDNLRAPYGNRPQEEIFRYTLAGVKWLFDNGAEIVILGCNTASANALRKIQQEWLPSNQKNKRVLGIIIPTAEDVCSLSVSGHVGILATKATVDSMAFEKEMKKRSTKVKVISQSGGKLVEMIEIGKDGEILAKEIKSVVSELLLKDELIDTIILGCTHYGLIENKIKQILPMNINIINQGRIVAVKLLDYIKRHDEISKKLSQLSSVSFYTTSINDAVKKKMMQLHGMDVPISTVTYEIK